MASPEQQLAAILERVDQTRLAICAELDTLRDGIGHLSEGGVHLGVTKPLSERRSVGRFSCYGAASPRRSVVTIGSEVCVVDEGKRNDLKKKFRLLQRSAREANLSVAHALDDALAKADTYMEMSCGDLTSKINLRKSFKLAGDELGLETFIEIMTCTSDTFEGDALELINAIRALYAKQDMNEMLERFAFSPDYDLGVAKMQKRSAAHWVKALLDPFAIFAIIANAIILGVSADADPDWPGWTLVEGVFTSIFMLEMIAKWSVYGIRSFFLGPDWKWNWADAMFVLSGMIDVVYTVATSDSTRSFDLQLLTMLRIARLARVTRLVRMLKFDWTKELFMMIGGIIGGLRTLIWGMLLLAFVIYCLAMVMRETFGIWCSPQWIAAANERPFCSSAIFQDYGLVLFGSVARSCLTVFRCFTEGCDSPDGLPLLHFLLENKHGHLYVLVYVACYLLVTFGLFNLILAIFVEATLVAARNDEKKRSKMKHDQYARLARKLRHLIVKILNVANAEFLESTSSERVHGGSSGVLSNSRVLACASFDAMPLSCFRAEISRNEFAKVMYDPHVEEMFEDLDLVIQDPMMLFDALDTDESQTLDIQELTKGLIKFSVQEGRGDVIANLFTVRAVQRRLENFERQCMAQQQSSMAGQARLEKAVLAMRADMLGTICKSNGSDKVFL